MNMDMILNKKQAEVHLVNDMNEKPSPAVVGVSVVLSLG